MEFKTNIFRSFKRIERRIAEILECKIADFKSLHNRRAVGKVVGNKTYDVTVGELKKCGKFENVLVSSKVHNEFSVEHHSKSKVSIFKFSRDPKLRREWLIETSVPKK